MTRKMATTPRAPLSILVIFSVNIPCSRAQSTCVDEALQEKKPFKTHTMNTTSHSPFLSSASSNHSKSMTRWLARAKVLRGLHPPPHFADTDECRAFDELAQEVSARLASHSSGLSLRTKVGKWLHSQNGPNYSIYVAPPTEAAAWYDVPISAVE